MAYYDGETLEQRVKRGQAPVDEVLAVASQVARGLAAAHAAGLVHRDIKPANLIRTRDCTVKILDFGLATLAGVEGITRPGDVFGTVVYMAPEQVRGQEVDARADVWALGVICYELLTGRRPFGGDNVVALSDTIVHDEPRSLAALRPHAPSDLVHVVAGALVKEQDARYQSATDMGVPSSRSGSRPSRRRPRPPVCPDRPTPRRFGSAGQWTAPM